MPIIYGLQFVIETICNRDLRTFKPALKPDQNGRLMTTYDLAYISLTILDSFHPLQRDQLHLNNTQNPRFDLRDRRPWRTIFPVNFSPIGYVFMFIRLEFLCTSIALSLIGLHSL